MDRGTNALRVLKNEVVPLRLGYIGMTPCAVSCLTAAYRHNASFVTVIIGLACI